VLNQHSLFALEKLRDTGFPIIIMTKNPGTLLEPAYQKAIDKLKTIVHVTIPFLDNRFEPFAPKPIERIEGARQLIDSGYNVLVRVDPLMPTYRNVVGQTKKELDTLFTQLNTIGVTRVVSKCLRLSVGIKKVYPKFYDELKPFYIEHGLRESVAVHILTTEMKKQLLTPVYELCNRYEMQLWTCMDNVGFGTGQCDGCDEIVTSTSINTHQERAKNKQREEQ
jgi:DNA repair photolyase